MTDIHVHVIAWAFLDSDQVELNHRRIHSPLCYVIKSREGALARWKDKRRCWPHSHTCFRRSRGQDIVDITATHTHTHTHTRMHDCFTIELTGECLKCLFRLTGGVPAVVVQSEARWARIPEIQVRIPLRAMGTFFPHTVSSIFRLSLTHTHTLARAGNHTKYKCRSTQASP